MNTDDILFDRLSSISLRPECWSDYTAEQLWNDPHIASRMLEFHLDPDSAPASRPHAFIDRSAAWMADRFSLNSGMKVADFGCGPGLYATRFHDSGARVTGIDFSAGSLRYAADQARKSGRNINYLEGNYLTVPLEGEFGLITQIYCDFCALNPKQRHQLLLRMRNHLQEDGRIVLDVFSISAMDARAESTEFENRLMGGFWAAGDYVGMRRTWKYTEESVVLDRYDIWESSRHRSIFNWLQYFSRQQLSNEFEAAGLDIIEWYGDVTGKPAEEGDPEMAVIARKK